MALTPEQRANIRKALATGQRLGASRKQLKALVEAMGVESNYRHLSGGDRDSVGVLQQRPSQGWGPAGESVEQDVKQFLAAAGKVNAKGMTAGQLAQAVQRSAYPDRYDQRSSEADQILRRFNGGRSPVPASDEVSGPQFETLPGTDRSAERKQAKVDYFSNHSPDALIDLALQLRDLKDSPGRRVQVPGGGPQRRTQGPQRGRGRANVLELFYNGPGGVNVKNGARVPQGFVEGHTDHVHVATAGKKGAVRLGKLAQGMGLTVRENPAFDPVDPVHTKGSYHYSGRAIDVSGDPALMRKFDRLVARRRRNRA